MENYCAVDIVSKIKSRELSAREVTEYYLSRIQTCDKELGAFISVLSDYATSRAEQIDKRIKSGEELGTLAGLPVAIKDNICTSFAPTTCASKILENYISPYDAHIIEKLNEQGAIVIGKTNLDEFAMGGSTENSGLQITRNPWNIERVPGGSSGGSAVAVAADMSPVAIGSDTGGSIRQPAAFCGVCGLKPTYGHVSRYGLVAFGSSLDQIGTFSRDVRDIALLMNVIAGHDGRDSTSVPENIAPKVDFLQAIEADDNDNSNFRRIGIPKEYLGRDGLANEIVLSIEEAIKIYEKLGYEITEISLPHTEYAVACYYLIATAEASSNLARYDGVHYGYRTPEPKDYIDVYTSSREEGFGDEVKRRIMLGTYALSAGYYDAYYLKALKVRTLIKKDFEQAFENVDVILTPVSPTPAFKIGEKVRDPLQMYLADIFTIPVNLAGLPGISIPCGFTSDNLPLGLQLIGRHFDEIAILKSAREYQRETEYHKQRPVM